jgi:ubiquinone/menaquinone biosynthesis C-methylase UbiE
MTVMLKINQIFDTIDKLEEAHVLLAALELNIFSILRQKKMSAVSISRQASCSRVELEILLNALVAMGALHKTSNLFHNTSETYRYLCESSPHYKRGTVSLNKGNRDEWQNLLATLRQGRDCGEYQGEDDPVGRQDFTHAMHERSVFYAQRIAEIAARQPVGRVCDLGGGPGSYLAAILKADKKARGILIDRPAALQVAKELLKNSLLLKRFEFIEGDFFEAPLPKELDTLLYSNILHIYNKKNNLKLLKRIHRGLVPGGRILIVDLFLKDNLTEPVPAAFFSLTMLMYTEEGRTYTFTETREMLTRIGFGRVKCFDLGRGSSLMEAVKR